MPSVIHIEQLGISAVLKGILALLDESVLFCFVFYFLFIDFVSGTNNLKVFSLFTAFKMTNVQYLLWNSSSDTSESCSKWMSRPLSLCSCTVSPACSCVCSKFMCIHAMCHIISTHLMSKALVGVGVQWGFSSQVYGSWIRPRYNSCVWQTQRAPAVVQLWPRLRA